MHRDERELNYHRREYNDLGVYVLQLHEERKAGLLE